MATTCDEEHPKLLFGKCRWCQRWILHGEVVPESAVEQLSPELENAKQAIHTILLAKLDLTKVNAMPEAQVKRELRLVVERLVEIEYPRMTGLDRERIVRAVVRMVVEKL